MVFQEPQTALNPVRTAGWLIGEALRAHGHSGRKQLRERVIELLTWWRSRSRTNASTTTRTNFPAARRSVLSSPWRWPTDPVLLLADEPTTALDVTVQAEILPLLRRLRDQTNAGILLITHNLGVVADIADSVVVLQLGEVVERGEVTEFFARPEHVYTRHLLDSVLRLPQPSEIAEQVAEVADASTPVLDVDTVSVVYPGRRGQAAFRALDHVSLKLAAGEVLGVVGESGSGKTTLGRTIAGLIPPATGTIRVDGRDVSTTSGSALRELRRRLAFVPQDPAASLDPHFTLEESIAEPLDIHRVGTRVERRKKVVDLLDAVRLPASFATRLPSELSGGQRQRVALARALVLKPTLLIADEPTSALDVSVQADVLELFATLQRELGFAAVFISHDLAVVERVSTAVAVLRAGQLVETGPATSVLTHPQHDYTRRLVAALPIPDPLAQRARRQATAAL